MANKKKVDNEAAVLEKIASMPEPYNMIGKRLHEIIMAAVPDLNSRLWYGAPGYAKEGPVLCFFRVDDYMTFGLTEKANFTVEDGAPDQLMACAWFLTSLDDATEQRIAEIVSKATG